MFTKTDLDIAAAAGCQVPNCDHDETNHHEIWLHAKCHPENPFFLFTDYPLRLVCTNPKCASTIAKFKGLTYYRNGEVCKGPSFEQSCHSESPVWAYYVRGSSRVVLVCYECKAEAGYIQLED